MRGLAFPTDLCGDCLPGWGKPHTCHVPDWCPCDGPHGGARAIEGDMTRPDNVPELVDISCMAHRLHVHQWTVRHWIRTQRSFPRPVAYLYRWRRPGAALWDWDEVYRYVQAKGGDG